MPLNSPDRSLKDILAQLNQHPGNLRFASSGVGSSDHLSAELLWRQSGTQGVHVPYKGGGPAIQDVIAGKVDAAFVNINSILGPIKAGKVRALGISSDTRSPALPNLPTLQEQGMKGAEVQSWQAIAVPAGVPPEVKAKLHDALVASLKAPEVRDKLKAQGFEIVADDAEHFKIVELFEFIRWKQLIESRNIRAD